jgi:hypothetical protein
MNDANDRTRGPRASPSPTFRNATTALSQPTTHIDAHIIRPDCGFLSNLVDE